jgi:hypothetical protein
MGSTVDAPPLPAALVRRGNGARFIVRDASSQALAYVYFEDEPGRRAAAKLLTREKRGGSPPTSPSCQTCCVIGLYQNPWHDDL